MELVTVRHDGALRAGQIEGDDIVLLRWPTVKELLADDGLAEAATDDGGEVIARAGADLAPIVPRPDKVICVGVNYADHIAEIGHTTDHPTYFAKYGRALIGANERHRATPDRGVDVDRLGVRAGAHHRPTGA